MTALAWLGLAGLSDAIVEWQAWFEQGVMQHWRSIKQWMIAVIFFWVPISIPSWLIDYFVVGIMIRRSLPKIRWVGPVPSGGSCEDIVVRNDIRLTLLLAHAGRFTCLMIWPLVIIHSIIMMVTDFPWEKEEDRIIYRNNSWNVLTKLIWYLISFIPFLFVVSNLLYDFG